MAQLTRIVGELVGAWRSQRLRSGAGDFDSSVTQGRSERTEILNQIREVREREKRKDSIIIRGLGNISISEVKVKFNQICSLINVDPIDLDEIKKKIILLTSFELRSLTKKKKGSFC